MLAWAPDKSVMLSHLTAWVLICNCILSMTMQPHYCASEVRIPRKLLKGKCTELHLATWSDISCSSSIELHGNCTLQIPCLLQRVEEEHTQVESIRK